ncbi:hypothetical protein JMUB7530_27890 [Staphylococcus aureus]
MQELQLVEQNETHYVDSREVAEMVGKEPVSYTHLTLPTN